MISLSKLILHLSISLLSLTFVTAIQAQENIIVTTGDWPPYISQDQKHNGVISHIITDIFADLGIQASMQFLPWSRAYNDTAKGLFPVTAVWMHKKEREIDFIYSDSVLTEQFVFFHLKERQFDWNSINDLKAFKIGGINASSYGPELDEALSQEKIIIDRVIRPQQNFNKLIHNRIDLFPFEVNVGHSMLKKYFSADEQETITYHPKPYLNNSSFVLFPKSIKGSKALSLLFNKALKKFKSSGQYDAYIKNFQQGYYNKKNKP